MVYGDFISIELAFGIEQFTTYFPSLFREELMDITVSGFGVLVR